MARTKIQGSNTSGLPVGSVQPFAGSSAPVGTLLCYGQAVSRTTYSDLFAAIGVTYGSGDGSTTFNLPDLRGRIPAGKDDMGGSAANRLTSGGSGVNGAVLGASGGAETHTLTSGQSGIPSHGHGITDNHKHAMPLNYNPAPFGNGTSGTGAALGATATLSLPLTSTVDSGSISVNSSSAADASSAHQNTQPTIVSNYVISYA